ncbi:MAG TPA: hypothetical protein VFS32_02390 [Candidatus Limnocylindrales bacterium]|nr:hypothetical protein [Candidatus Limnocylindrales bacterium]
MLILLFAHVALMFAAVALTTGTLALLVIAHQARRLEVVGPAIASLPLARISPPLFVLGGLAGVATAWAFGYSLLSPWLVLAYVGFAAGVVFAVVVTSGRMERLARGDDVVAVGRGLRIDLAVNVALFALLIADMVFKPFG